MNMNNKQITRKQKISGSSQTVRKVGLDTHGERNLTVKRKVCQSLKPKSKEVGDG